MAFDKQKFLEDLVQLQLKHGVIIEAYDVSLWTAEQGQRSYELTAGDESYLVTEASIRDQWNDQTVRVEE